MKKCLLLLFIALLSATTGNAQCSTSSAPSNNCTYGDQIQTFMLNSISAIGNGGCGSSGYNSFSSPVWTLQLGSTYNWSATVGSGYYSQGLAIWIDLNNDGFYANSEMLVSSSPALSHASTLTIPFSSLAGPNHRMRVRCSYNTNLSGGDVCTNNIGSYGETEDYFVTLVCPASSPTISIAASNTLVCLGNSATLTASGAGSYTWSGGISNGVSFNPTTTTSYTVIAGYGTACPGNTTSAVQTVSVYNNPLPINAFSNPSVICAGNTAILSAGGATSYTWMPGSQNGSSISVSPSANAVYTVTGTNGGCPGTTTISLAVNPNPTITTMATSTLICEGTPVTFTASGASSYTWQTLNQNGSVVTATPMVPTSYIVSGTNSFGCISSANQVVLVSPAPTLAVTSNMSYVCAGDAVMLTASGANTYLWDNNATTPGITVNPTVTTTFSITGTSTANCSSSATISVDVFSPTIAISSPSAICSGQSATLIATGADTYTWSNNSQFNTTVVNPTITTTYTVSTITNTNSLGCPGQASVTLVVNPLPSLAASISRSVICKGESATLTASGANSYLWNTSATSATIAVTPTLITAMQFTVTGSSAQGCSKASVVSLLVNACNGLSENTQGKPAISIFPNPNNGTFSIVVPTAMALTIINELGQEVRQVELKAANNFTANISDLPTGVYFIMDKTGSGAEGKTIIVQK